MINKSVIRDAFAVIAVASFCGIWYNACGAAENKRLPWLRLKEEAAVVSDADLFSSDAPPAADVPLAATNPASAESALDKTETDSKQSNPPATKNEPPVESQKISSESMQQEEGKPKAVTYDQVVRLHRDKTVLFLDARNAVEFAEGTISGSKNIFPMEFEQRIPEIISFPREQRIVVFCGGGQCDLSHELADKMVQMGFKKVFIYLGGYSEWKQKQQAQ